MSDPRLLFADEEWAFFEPFAVEKGPTRGRRRDHGLVVDGVLASADETAWRDLHSYFGTWNSVDRV
jgi:hypothetical protein